MTADELLRHARDLLRRPRDATAGLWPRAAAVLGRQALERVLDDYWAWRAPGVELASRRAQLLCLDSYTDPALARRISHTWKALSRACHYHPYELEPTESELRNWLDDVRALEGSLGR